MPLPTRILCTTLALAAAPVCLGLAQQRRILPSGDAQAQLMGYYAAAMGFSPVGLPDPHGRWEVGASLGFIPSLPVGDRAVGFGGTKVEDSNLCPVYPRLVAAKGFGRVALEAGWTPPLKACGVQADVGSLAASYRLRLAPGWDALLRASTVFGYLDAAITCSADATRDATDQTCFGGQPSKDRVSPLTGSLDALLGYGGLGENGLGLYLMLGVRREQVHFDVNYQRAAGALPALDDRQRLASTLTRVHGALGATLTRFGPVRLGGELYYAPGALLTLRGRATVALGRGR